MLGFAGLGLSGLESISIETQKLLKDADIVYLELFTSPISKSEISKIKKIVKGEFKIAKRWMVEDGKEILKNSKRKTVVLLTYGDPFIATTHIELRTRAIQDKIKTKTIIKKILCILQSFSITNILKHYTFRQINIIVFSTSSLLN